MFGSGSVDPFLGGSGSGQIASDNSVYLYDALETAGIDYCEDLRNSYDAWYEVNQYNAIYRSA